MSGEITPLGWDQLVRVQDVRAIDPRIGYAALDGRSLRISGDDAGAEHRLVYFDGERIAMLRGWASLRDWRDLKVSPAGCQFMLTYGLVPPPFTLYAHVYHLGLGDRLTVDLQAGRAEYAIDFPYYAASSREDQKPSTQALKRHLAQALQRAFTGEGVLMASGGKDSAGLMIGLGELGAGRRVTAVTYEPGTKEAEAKSARHMANRMGIRHRTVFANPKRELEALFAFLERAPVACADVALLPYVYSLSELGASSGTVLDGLMNDVYMGYVQPAREAALCRLSLPRRAPALWGRFESPDLGQHASYVAKSVQMFPAERILPGSRLAPSTTEALLPQRTPFHEYFSRFDAAYSHLGSTDFRAMVRGQTDSCGMTLKGALTALHRGMDIAFPYADQALSDYCFHLPRSARYSEKKRSSKLLLRKLIVQTLGEQPYFEAKGSFRLDIMGLLADQGEVIRAEIRRANRLFSDADRWSEFLFARQDNYVHAYALVSWFLLAAWLNRRPAAQLCLLEEEASESSGHLSLRFG